LQGFPPKGMIDRQPEIFAHRAADTTDMGVLIGVQF
jgi:hypothetical protein